MAETFRVGQTVRRNCNGCKAVRFCTKPRGPEVFTICDIRPSLHDSFFGPDWLFWGPEEDDGDPCCPSVQCTLVTPARIEGNELILEEP
jgi:hypothetical protein